MSTVRERSVQLNTEISRLGGKGKDATFGSNLKLTISLPVVEVESSSNRLGGTDLQFPFLEVRG